MSTHPFFWSSPENHWPGVMQQHPNLLPCLKPSYQATATLCCPLPILGAVLDPSTCHMAAVAH